MKAHHLVVPMLLAWACMSGDESGDGAETAWSPVAESASEPQSPDPVSEVLPERVATGAAARGTQSEARALSQPVPWDGELDLPFELAENRDEARARSLANRATRRAFEGAPPVMMHSPRFGGGSTCLECHTSGFEVDEEIVGRAMSHPPLASCLQCHIEAGKLPPSSIPENTFLGQRPPAVPNARPFPGAPPAIPHPILMRGRCLSCHGEFGYPGLRTSHPERALCMQCHVPAYGAVHHPTTSREERTALATPVTR